MPRLVQFGHGNRRLHLSFLDRQKWHETGLFRDDLVPGRSGGIIAVCRNPGAGLMDGSG